RPVRRICTGSGWGVGCGLARRSPPRASVCLWWLRGAVPQEPHERAECIGLAARRAPLHPEVEVRAMADRVPMTPRGYAQLESELKRLKTVDRIQIVKEIEAARAHGDISENAEFEAAKERQAQIEARIRHLEDRLARAQVIDPASQSPDAVRFG